MISKCQCNSWSQQEQEQEAVVVVDNDNCCCVYASSEEHGIVTVQTHVCMRTVFKPHITHDMPFD